MVRPRPFLLGLFVVAALALLAWQSARMQSPLRRITNTTEEGISLNPSISGDGRFVAFESTEDVAHAGGGESFRAIRANVGVEPATFLQMGATRAPAPGVSQDGSRIAFASKDDPLGINGDGNSEIFLYDGAKLIQVTNTSPGDLAHRIVNGNFQPSISDDGRFVAFSSNRDLTNQNADSNLEMFIFDSVALNFTQLTNSSGIVGFSDAKISGNGSAVAYIRDPNVTNNGSRDLLLQNRAPSSPVRILASNVPGLAMAYGRAISDDGLRVVWSAQTATNTTQVVLFDGRGGNTMRQITTLSSRVTEVPLHPTISGDGSRIAFAARRTVSGAGSNSDGSVELYTYDIPSSTFGRVTNATSSSATADVVSSLSDDGSVIAFNFPRVLSGALTNNDSASNSEIYVIGTPARPPFGALTVLNGASFGHEPSSTKAVAPDSIAVAIGNNLANTTQQTLRQPDGSFPTNAGGTTVTVNGRSAQIFFVSPTQVNFLVPPATEIGTAEVIVKNPDGFPSKTTVTTLRAVPGVFTSSGDGLGEGVVLNADTLQPGPFDPSSGNLRLIIFSTGVRNATAVSLTAGGRALTVESIAETPNMPGMDEIHVLVPADLRGAGKVDLVVRADGRDSNPVSVEFLGDSRRDVMINEFLADPPDGSAGDANHDGVRDSGDDEFVELVNTTTHDIDLMGYRILTRSTTSSDIVRHEFVAGYILPACTSLVLFAGGNPDRNDPIFGGAQVYTTQTGSLSLTNSSGVITLRDRSGANVDSVAYGGSTGLNGDANQSLTRAPDISGPFTLHQSASGSGGRLFSPGTRVNGSPFALCSPISRIDVSPLATTIEVGQHQQFTARASDAGGNEVFGVIFLWTSSNITVAGIDQNGLATGFTPAMTEIRASGRGVTSAPATLTVNTAAPVLTSVTISPASATIGVGETQFYTAQAKDQFGQNIGGVTITFASNNSTVATVDSVSATSSTGSATATVTGRASSTAQIAASANNGSTTVTSTPATLTVEPSAGQLLISEFRTRGPAGASDEFVEIYNPTTSTQVISGLKVRASNGTGTISDRVTITAGTALGSGCHYLIANTSSGGYSGSVPANQTYGTGITDDGGIAITQSNGTTIDMVGLSNGSAFKEGTPLALLSANVDQSYERKPGGSFGNGTDTNNNAADFILNSASSNPQNASSGCLDLTSADLSITKSDSPDPVITGSNVTYTITVTNNGAANAQSVVVTDNLPGSVSLVSCAANTGGVCGGSGNNRTITFASLAGGSSATIALVATANGAAGSTISNTATVSSNTPDANSGNNSATTTTAVQAPLPGLSINDVALNEGNTGTTTFSFTVSLSAPAPAGGVSFDIATQDNTALATNNDYIARSLTGQTIPAGQTTYTFNVKVIGDTIVEPNETFFVSVSNVVGATVIDGQGQGTIQNDDTATLVISQLYGGGGNAGAQYTNDFVEIFNRSTTTINFAVTPYSVQYAGATATFGSNKVDLTSGTIAPGQYFLVQLSSGGANGVALPTPDATGSINMAAAAGKVALVAGTTSLTGSGCPLPGTVADFVGYGTTANCFEGSGRAPAPGNTTADLRKNGGCTDTNDNAADFLLTAPFPRNTSSPLNNCTPGTPPNLTINDVSVVEGNSGTTTATFTVSLSAPAPSTDVTFDIATQDNTATTANSDYVAKTLTSQVIPAGQTTYSFTVTVNGDVAIEPNETFFVNVTNVTGATVTYGQGVGTIQNDDLPALSVNDVSLTEGNGGPKTFSFTVSLSAPAPGTVAFDIATQDNTATVADNDYVARSLTSQTITTGNSTFTFDVTVNGDLTIEPDESFFVNATNVSGATLSDGQGLGAILNDDSPELTINDVTVTEPDSGTATAQFIVTLSPTSTQTVMVNYTTANNTAIAPADYQTTSGTLTFAPGQATQTIDVLVNGDTTNEAICETFFVNLSTQVNAAISDPQGIGNITDNDGTKLVISQIYGGGGNASATYTNDFIEIFNRGNTAFSLNGMSVQYAAATSTTGNYLVTALPNLLLQPGQYFLIQESSGGATGIPLPTPDATGTITMAAGAGKVALVNSITALAAAGCPSGPTIIDFVGYGTTANCREGTSTADNAPGPANNTTSTQRKQAGCQDVNNNQTDFATAAVTPRNTANAVSQCSCSTSYSSMLNLSKDWLNAEPAAVVFHGDSHLDKTRY
ncbi:MAG: lamin tail domain-containing protein [Blastocatellia bacterium]|nr:lamin tail domain-containing protein [Blastocatellia bacterium]